MQQMCNLHIDIIAGSLQADHFNGGDHDGVCWKVQEGFNLWWSTFLYCRRWARRSSRSALLQCRRSRGTTPVRNIWWAGTGPLWEDFSTSAYFIIHEQVLLCCHPVSSYMARPLSLPWTEHHLCEEDCLKHCQLHFLLVLVQQLLLVKLLLLTGGVSAPYPSYPACHTHCSHWICLGCPLSLWTSPRPTPPPQNPAARGYCQCFFHPACQTHSLCESVYQALPLYEQVLHQLLLPKLLLPVGSASTSHYLPIH